MKNILLVALFTAFFGQDAPVVVRQAARTVVATQISSRSSVEMELRQSRDFYRNALHQLVSGDEQGEILAAWHDTMATYATVLPGTYQLVGIRPSSALAQTGITIVLLSEERFDELGDSQWQYRPRLRRMNMLPPGRFSAIWSAAILAHELTHAMEYDSGLLPEGNDPTSDQHQDGEIRAYNIEIRLLDRASHGALWQFVDEMLDGRGFHRGATAQLPDRIQPTMQEAGRFSALFGEASSEEETLTRIVLLQYAVNYRFAYRMSLGESWKRRYNLFLRRLQENRRPSHR